MFIALYRWRLKEGCEADFCEGWRRLTLEIRDKHGGWGSRLHKAEDGTFVAYAQWKDQEARDAAFASQTVIDTEAVELMRRSIAQRLPDVYMDVVDDLLLKL